MSTIIEPEEAKPFKVEVIADNTGTWCGNGLTFATVQEAEAYAQDLWSRWTAVRSWRVVNIDTGIVVEEKK